MRIGFLLLVYILFPTISSGQLFFSITHLDIIIDEFTESYDFSFHYKNTSQNPVKIVDIKTSCGCVFLDKYNRHILPNAQGTITGRFISNGLLGKQERKIILQTNNLNQEFIYLTLHIETLPIATLDPKVIIWQKGEFNAKSTIITLHSSNYHIYNLECSSNNFYYRLNKKDDTTFYLEIIPKQVANGNNILKIYISTQNGNRIFYLYLVKKRKLSLNH